uniref:Uncharacterized protein n=1 Tax=Strix occidentalis caurina TaxID=311401 RepID=A0A8D0FQP0_STROC
MDFCTKDRSRDQPMVDKMQKKYWKLKQLHAKLEINLQIISTASAENVYSEPKSGRCGMGVH